MSFPAVLMCVFSSHSSLVIDPPFFPFVGGLYFSLTLLWSQISTIIFAILYSQNYEQGDMILDRRSKLSENALYAIVSGLAVVWLVSFYSFIKKIKPAYLSTFFGTMTGRQYAIHVFRTGDDITKSDIFGINVHLWLSIKDEVKEWTMSNWTRWEEEKPAWFTEHFISTVDDEFIPKKMDPKRRRSSLLGGAGGGDPKSRNERQRSSKVSAAATTTSSPSGE
jgi:hypothetical protein